MISSFKIYQRWNHKSSWYSNKRDFSILPLGLREGGRRPDGLRLWRKSKAGWATIIEFRLKCLYIRKPDGLHFIKNSKNRWVIFLKLRLKNLGTGWVIKNKKQPLSSCFIYFLISTNWFLRTYENLLQIFLLQYFSSFVSCFVLSYIFPFWEKHSHENTKK